VRGIVSSVDIIWSTEGSDIQAVSNIYLTILSGNLVLYRAILTIPLLRTAQENQEYQCQVVIIPPHQ